MSLNEIVQQKRDDILRIAAKYGAYNVRLFGSIVRGEADQESDVDILVDLEPGRNLLDLGGLLMELQELLQCRVDVITERGLRPRLHDLVLTEAEPL
ncbi:MAG: nucleotidyltransferase [Anaerolineae bacterium]|nr:nucleotidyltransferase family protein [Anaerolineales bacterium]MCQ3980116.1 nucleotidyltransferase [Anaerolineae bacterium]